MLESSQLPHEEVPNNLEEFNQSDIPEWGSSVSQPTPCLQHFLELPSGRACVVPWFCRLLGTEFLRAVARSWWHGASLNLGLAQAV